VCVYLETTPFPRLVLQLVIYFQKKKRNPPPKKKEKRFLCVEIQYTRKEGRMVMELVTAIQRKHARNDDCYVMVSSSVQTCVI
jgi:hypothetical protein